MINRCLFFSVVLLIAGTVSAQKLFTGKVVYEVVVEGDLSPIVASAIPEKVETTIREGMIREDILGQTLIYDGEKKTRTVFVEGGKRVAVVQTLQEILMQEKITDLAVQETDESKMIANFLCKKAVVSYLLNDETIVQSLYYSDKIKVGEAYQMNTIFRNINGFPLEYEIYMKGARLLFRAVEVQMEKVDKKKFLIPKGYDVYMTED